MLHLFPLHYIYKMLAMCDLLAQMAGCDVHSQHRMSWLNNMAQKLDFVLCKQMNKSVVFFICLQNRLDTLCIAMNFVKQCVATVDK